MAVEDMLRLAHAVNSKLDEVAGQVNAIRLWTSEILRCNDYSNSIIVSIDEELAKEHLKDMKDELESIVGDIPDQPPEPEEP